MNEAEFKAIEALCTFGKVETVKVVKDTLETCITKTGLVVIDLTK